ncbi:MAG: phosphoenolpyruvate carboxykinase (ATP), partial [Ignavibacteria bacterium]
MKTNEEIKESLNGQGISHLNEVFYNLSRAELYEHAISNAEAELTEHGALLAITVPHTGRSANDKFLVEESTSTEHVWWGKVNKPFPQERFNALKARMTAYLQGSDVYVLDCFAGADANYALPVRVVNQYAWHNLFAQNMFIQANESQLASFEPGFTILHCPDFKANPEIDGTRSETFILMDFSQKLVLIGGTHYAGEIKKSIFTALNYLMPLRGVLSMHCSANIGNQGDTALFFGLSGTGKTTLSTDPERALIGDDEHGWSD